MSGEESILVNALHGKRGKRVPVWFMRQAGRFLSEYRALREKHSMLEVIKTPELAAEVTLQPLRRFDLDGAIIFADILNPLMGMGVELDFVAGEGPKIFNPVRSAADVERLRIPDVTENVGYTLDAIRLVRAELEPRGIPVLGFAGAPFTLSSYLIEGESSSKHELVRSFMLKEQKAWAALQEKLSTMVSEYMIAQVEAGVSAVQLFDSWLGNLGPIEYRRFAAPYLNKIITEVKRRTNVPVIFFATGTSGLLECLQDLPFDVLGVDWRIGLSDAAKRLGRSVPMQGNIDPHVLAGPAEYLEGHVHEVLKQGSKLPAHILNVGHGILPHTPPENVKRVLEIARSS